MRNGTVNGELQKVHLCLTKTIELLWPSPYFRQDQDTLPHFKLQDPFENYAEE